LHKANKTHHEKENPEALKEMIVKNNTRMAAEILRSNCRSGKLIIDLELEQYFLQGFVDPDKQFSEL
jgi:hypothetical protein